MQERRKLSLRHLQLKAKMLRKTPGRQKPASSTEWGGQNKSFISILTQEQLAACQISGVGLNRVQHWLICVNHASRHASFPYIGNYGANLQTSAVS
jgi:hypothetical protein